MSGGERAQLQSLLGNEKIEHIFGNKQEKGGEVQRKQGARGAEKKSSYKVLSSDHQSENEAKGVAQRLFSPEEKSKKGGVQRKTGRGEQTVGADIGQRIDQSRGSGRSLDGGTRQEMEATLGGDFGDVRIHTGREANELNRAVNANAFTSKNDIFLSDGAADTKSTEGKTRLAEELVHVQQQTGGTVQRQAGGGEGGAAVSQSLSGGGSGGVIQRDDAPMAPDRTNLLATTNPEAFLRNQAQYKWENVVDMYKRGELNYDDSLPTNEHGVVAPDVARREQAGMNALLSFRLENTLLKNQTGQYTHRVSLMQEAANELNQEEDIDFDWNYGAGTSSPTSDIDSNLSGDGTAEAMTTFYEKFRAYWNKHESGVIFDVNVYIRDYLPVQGGGMLAKANKGRRQGKHRKRFFLPEKFEQGKSYSYEGTGEDGLTEDREAMVRFETMFTEGSDAYRDAMKDEEVYALVKTRMDMDEGSWRKYVSGNINRAITTKAKARQARLKKLFDRVDHIFRKRKKEIDDLLSSYDDNPELNHLSREEKVMKAENMLYAKKSKTIDLIRKRLKRLRAQPDVPWKAVERLQLHLVRALHETSIYANEAYVTGASVVHVVANKQILSTKAQRPISDPNHLQVNGHKHMKVRLTKDQYMHSFEEQLGFIFKEFKLYKSDTNKALIKSAKYIHRMGNAARHIYELNNRSIAPLRAFREYGKKLLALKLGDKPNNPQETLVRNQYGSQSVPDGNGTADMTPIKYHYDWTHNDKFLLNDETTRQDVSERSEEMIEAIRARFIEVAVRVREAYEDNR